MADELADGEFWLPPQFLTDADIISDFYGSTSETSDEEININNNVRNINFFVPVTAVKVPVRSVSPQSTLFGYEQGSSDGSPSEQGGENGSATTAPTTLELLNEAAGEVAKMKLKSEKCAGTGFFDCSKTKSGVAVGVKTLIPPAKPPQKSTPMIQAPYFPHPLLRQFPTAIPAHKSQNKATKNTRPSKVGNNGNNRTLGLPQSAWPPLPGQSQAQAQDQPPVEPAMRFFVAPPRDSVGTGVFFPRPIVSENISEETPKKSKSSKRSQQRRNRSSKANDDEIQLPSEWVY